MMKGKPKPMPKIRHPYVAGTFYRGNAKALRDQIENCFLHKFGPQKLPEVASNDSKKIIGLVCPHAGYEYSGPIAANAYYELAQSRKPETIVILGPNHTGYGSAIDIMIEGVWRTPLGDVQIDEEIANQIMRETRFTDVNDVAHRFEHSIEVQIPFLQYLYGDEFKFVPISFLLQDLKSAVEIGEALGKILANVNALVIASSDLTHYEPQAKADFKDRAVLEAVERMDEELLFSTIQKQNISACGYGPIASLIKFAKALGCKETKVLAHKTSGDIINDYSSVVGYAAVSFTK
jgi:AmmeMemoRadiSam system protein B